MIVDPDFCDHWKTRMLVGLLGGDESAPVLVLRLWAHCQNRRQSHFDNLSASALRALCRFSGNADELEAALAGAGFVVRDGNSLTVCNWDQYNASLIAAWKNGGRGGRPSFRKPSGNPGVNPEETHGLPMGTPRGLRVEKSREEQSREDSNTGADDAATGSSKTKENPSVVYDEQAIPPQLRDTDFPDAWRDWIEYKHQRRDPVKLQGQKQTFTAALSFGGSVAAEKLRLAMANGWKGWAFNDRGSTGGKSSSVTASQRYSE